MPSGIESSPNQGSEDPYSQLGLEPGASFEMVQKARDERLAEVGSNPQARAKIEAMKSAGIYVSNSPAALGSTMVRALRG